MPIWNESKLASAQWKRWFAWHKVHVGSNADCDIYAKWVWVERRLIDYCDGPKAYEYRLPESTERVSPNNLLVNCELYSSDPRDPKHTVESVGAQAWKIIQAQENRRVGSILTGGDVPGGDTLENMAKMLPKGTPRMEEVVRDTDCPVHKEPTAGETQRPIHQGDPKATRPMSDIMKKMLAGGLTQPIDDSPEDTTGFCASCGKGIHLDLASRWDGTWVCGGCYITLQKEEAERKQIAKDPESFRTSCLRAAEALRGLKKESQGMAEPFSVIRPNRQNICREELRMGPPYPKKNKLPPPALDGLLGKKDEKPFLKFSDMKPTVEHLIACLHQCNPKAKVGVIAHCQEYPFTLTVGGGSDGEAYNHSPEVHFYVDALCQSERAAPSKGSVPSPNASEA